MRAADPVDKLFWPSAEAHQSFWCNDGLREETECVLYSGGVTLLHCECVCGCNHISILSMSTQRVYRESGGIFSLLMVETKNICCPNLLGYYWDSKWSYSTLQKLVASLFLCLLTLLFSVQMGKMDVNMLTNQYMHLPANCRQKQHWY